MCTDWLTVCYKRHHRRKGVSPFCFSLSLEVGHDGCALPWMHLLGDTLWIGMLFLCLYLEGMTVALPSTQPLVQSPGSQSYLRSGTEQKQE